MAWVRWQVAGILMAAIGLTGTAAPPPDPVAAAVASMYTGVRSERLPNGLRIYLKPIPQMPTVTVMTVYRVGSADELPDQTGLSHYLEHLMFKGTDRLMPGDIDRTTRRAGGQNNAYTTTDLTNYHFNLAADRWKTALEIEADRMRNLRIDARHEFEQEKGAVISELDGYEDDAWDLENKAILPLLFGEKSPYGHPIIGEREHVTKATAEIIKAHYDRWYHPNNASLVLVGGFDADAALAKIKELFGPIPAGKLPERPDPKPVTREAPVYKKIPSKFDVNRMVIGFNTVKMGDPEDYVLDVVEHLLASGKTGRLYRRLVLEKELAAEVKCSNLAGRYPGWFSIELEVMNEVDWKKAEAALLAELQNLATEPPTDAELARVKRNILTSILFSEEGVHELADSFVNAVGVLDLEYRQTYPARLAAITAADVQAVAKKLLRPEQRVVVHSVPEEKGKGAVGKGHRPGVRASRHPRREAKPVAIATGSDFSKTKRVVLPNGLIVLLLENHRVPIVYAEAHVRRVRLHEPDAKAGIVGLLGRLFEEGTDLHTDREIADLIEGVGGALAMSGAGGNVKVFAPDRSLGLKVLLECLTRSKLEAAAIRRCREHILADIEEYDRTPSMRAINEFHERVYGKHPFSRPSSGQPETLEKLTAEDCREFHRSIYVPNNTIVVVTGDFNSEAVLNEITDLTKDWAKRDLPPLDLPTVTLPKKFREKVVTMETARQVNIYLGHVGVGRAHPEYYKLLVMDHVLGLGSGFTDRLSSKLRDRNGLAYTVTASITETANEAPGTFAAFVGTYPEKYQQVKQMLLAEVRRLCEEPVTEQEVADAKQYLEGQMPFLLGTNADFAKMLLQIERFDLGLDYPTKYRQAIAAVTAADVFAVARKHLHPDQMILVAAGPITSRGQPLNKDCKNEEAK